MNQNVHFITFATADLDAARRFYIEGLGWHPLLDVGEEIIFFQVAPGLVLGLFDAEKFNRDLLTDPDQSVVSGTTVAHNVDSDDDVRAVAEQMHRAGGRILKDPQPTEFGGSFHAHVQDPNGIIWEIAHNPGWSVADDGTVRLG